jgi:HAD superfamily hydrolase (TIGR01662 family)
MLHEIVIIAGPPASGKTTLVKQFVDKGYHRFNRDELGCSITDIYPMIRKVFDGKPCSFVLDNVYATKESRKGAIDIAKTLNLSLHIKWMLTTAEQAQFFAARRQMQRYGKVLRPEEYKAHKKDPNMFPPGAQFAYWKQVEKPTMDEGFASIEEVPVSVNLGSEYKNKALILDFDGTLRITKSGKIYPSDPDDVVLLDGRKEILRRNQAEGFILCGASNQSGIAKEPGDPKHVSEESANLCFKRTNDLLGLPVPIDVIYAPDRSGVPQSFLRKPFPGMGVHFIEKYKLNPAECIVVGDMTSDATFAKRCGFQFCHANEFFR